MCQRTRVPAHRDELPLHPVKALQPFEKGAVDFRGPITPVARHSQARYIITATYYLTRWAEEIPVKDCTAKTKVSQAIKVCISSMQPLDLC